MTTKHIKIPKKDWRLLVERRYLPFSISLNMYFCGGKYLESVAPFGTKEDYFSIYKDKCYIPANQVEIVSKYQIEQLRKQGPQFLWNMTRACVRAGEKMLADAEEIQKTDFSKCDNETLASSLEDIGQKYKEFTVYLLISLSMENFFDEELQKILRKRIDDDDKVADMQQRLIQPIKFNVSQEEILSLFSIAAVLWKKGIIDFAKLSQDVNKLIENHLLKFAWIQILWFAGKPFAYKDIIKRLKAMLKEDFEQKFVELKQKNYQVIKDTNLICQELSCTEDEKEIIGLAKEHVFIRTYRADILKKANYFILPLVNETARRLGVSRGDILYLTWLEIIKSLRLGRVISSVNIDARKKSWAIFRNGKDVIVLQGKKAVEQFGLEQGFIENHTSVDEIRGIKAYGGKVVGVVRVLLSVTEIDKVERGDILVGIMTFPSFIMAMEKAAAFVTDEGGILCHASIIAREMKKPCVIGTKIATKVLRDGDLVEVDADRGIVNILKRR